MTHVAHGDGGTTEARFTQPTRAHVAHVILVVNPVQLVLSTIHIMPMI